MKLGTLPSFLASPYRLPTSIAAGAGCGVMLANALYSLVIKQDISGFSRRLTLSAGLGVTAYVLSKPIHEGQIALWAGGLFLIATTVHNTSLSLLLEEYRRANREVGGINESFENLLRRV